jgi:hypothetical protein
MNARADAHPTARTEHRAPRIAAVVLAAALQIVVLVPFTVASGLLAPLWAVVLFYALGGASVVVLVRTAQRAPLLAPIVPIVHGLVLFVAITGGEHLLGWTA